MIKLVNCSLDQFWDRCADRPVMHIGGGKNLQAIAEAGKGRLRHGCVADNFKAGSFLIVGGENIPCLSLEDAGAYAGKYIPVITTMRYADEFIRQLDGMPMFHGIEVYVFECMSQAEEGGPEGIPAQLQECIPRTIHYFWFGKNEMPESYKKNIESWKKYCPDYTLLLWNEDNYDVRKNDYMYEAWQAEKWGFVPDYARLDVVRQYGGIYLDTDVEIVRPLDELLHYPFFAGFENISRVNLGHGFGACRDNAMVCEMLDLYEGMHFRQPDGSYNLMASPNYQTAVLERKGLKKNGHTQAVGDGIVLSPEYLSPVNEFGYGSPTTNTFSIHQYAATWYGEKERQEKQRVMDNYRMVMERLRKCGQEEQA